MFSDFKEYAKNQSGYSVDKTCHPIYSGQEKIANKKVVISTWQSIYKLPKEWFAEFDVVIGDEVHLFKAKSLTGIMSKLENTKYRFGTTGTLDGSHTHKLVLEGLFGTKFSVTTTKQLMEKKQLAELKIECVVLKYDDAACKSVKKLKYNEEIQFLVQNEKRNTFIKNLAVNTKSNCLVLFQFVETHGKVLYDLIKEKAHKIDPNRKVFFISGNTDGNTREEIRRLSNENSHKIILEFGKHKIKVNPTSKVLLSCGTTKCAKDITIHDDISDDWIQKNLNTTGK